MLNVYGMENSMRTIIMYRSTIEKLTAVLLSIL